MHERLGIAERMAELGPRVVRPFMPDQHRSFFGQLPFILVGSADAAGRLWASLLAGPPGFVTSPQPQRLEVDTLPVPGDPLAATLRPGAPLAVLGIELPTRRRNRANGHVAAVDAEGFALRVEESFGNCPKYIVRRDYRSLAPDVPVAVERIGVLDDAARILIGQAETFFVASSAGPDRLPDVSHRGGQPGFVTLDPAGALTIPDYAGNMFFNTLGNLLVNPRAGLLFPDFATGDLLQLTGSASVELDDADLPAYPGAQRLWRFRPEAGQWLHGAFRLRFAPGEASPFAPRLSA